MAKEEKALELLAQIIVRRIKEEFADKRMSGNLINTISVEKLEDRIDIKIPAEIYNMLEYQRSGTIIHTNKGSYASKLDEEGSSFMVYPNKTRKGAYRVKPGHHKGFVNKVVNESIQEWSSQLQKMSIERVEG